MSFLSQNNTQNPIISQMYSRTIDTILCIYEFVHGGSPVFCSRCPHFLVSTIVLSDLYELSYLDSYVVEIIQSLSFSDWYTSLRIMSSKTIDVATVCHPFVMDKSHCLHTSQFLNLSVTCSDNIMFHSHYYTYNRLLDFSFFIFSNKSKKYEEWWRLWTSLNGAFNQIIFSLMENKKSFHTVLYLEDDWSVGQGGNDKHYKGGIVRILKDITYHLPPEKINTQEAKH